MVLKHAERREPKRPLVHRVVKLRRQRLALGPTPANETLDAVLDLLVAAGRIERHIATRIRARRVAVEAALEDVVGQALVLEGLALLQAVVGVREGHARAVVGVLARRDVDEAALGVREAVDGGERVQVVAVGVALAEAVGLVHVAHEHRVGAEGAAQDVADGGLVLGLLVEVALLEDVERDVLEARVGPGVGGAGEPAGVLRGLEGRAQAEGRAGEPEDAFDDFFGAAVVGDAALDSEGEGGGTDDALEYLEGEAEAESDEEDAVTVNLAGFAERHEFGVFGDRVLGEVEVEALELVFGGNLQGVPVEVIGGPDICLAGRDQCKADEQAQEQGAAGHLETHPPCPRDDFDELCSFEVYYVSAGVVVAGVGKRIADKSRCFRRMAEDTKAIPPGLLGDFCFMSGCHSRRLIYFSGFNQRLRKGTRSDLSRSTSGGAVEGSWCNMQ